MSERLLKMIEAWDGVGVVLRHDAESGAWIFICLHDNRHGPCTGGTRLHTYPSLADALEDGMRLAAGMTSKWAALDQPFGGGKAVLAVPDALSADLRRGLMLRYGALVESLRGGFLTGEDLGTTSDDMRIMAETTRHVHGFDRDSGEKLDPSPYTARGVLRGIEAALEHAFGAPEVRGRTFLVQGIGSVGMRLAELLAEAGGRLLLTDIDEERLAATAARLGGESVTLDAVYSTPCDVYAPCAIGATVNHETIPELRCRIVAGSANNQLATAADAERLRERDILYVPDYVINGGGALSFALLGQGVEAGAPLDDRMSDIGHVVGEILAEAAKRKESPLAAADRRVRRVLRADASAVSARAVNSVP